jgi:hypothetical protein
LYWKKEKKTNKKMSVGVLLKNGERKKNEINNGRA